MSDIVQDPPDAGNATPPRSPISTSMPVCCKRFRTWATSPPSPIQAATIPPLLEGRDVVGLAQTGTGKTAAFAVPILSRIDTSKKRPQALILAPTRELALQVAEAFGKYSAHIPGGLHVLPIYGGQAYGVQLSGAASRRPGHRRHPPDV